MIFFAEALTTGAVFWKGATLELFNPDNLSVVAGSRLRCLFVEVTQQVVALDLIA